MKNNYYQQCISQKVFSLKAFVNKNKQSYKFMNYSLDRKAITKCQMSIKYIDKMSI